MYRLAFLLLFGRYRSRWVGLRGSERRLESIVGENFSAISIDYTNEKDCNGKKFLNVGRFSALEVSSLGYT